MHDNAAQPSPSKLLAEKISGLRRKRDQFKENHEQFSAAVSVAISSLPEPYGKIIGMLWNGGLDKNDTESLIKITKNLEENQQILYEIAEKINESSELGKDILPQLFKMLKSEHISSIKITKLLENQTLSLESIDKKISSMDETLKQLQVSHNSSDNANWMSRTEYDYWGKNIRLSLENMKESLAHKRDKHKIIENLLNSAQNYFLKMKFDDALNQYNIVLESDPNNYEAGNNKACILLRLKKWDQVISMCKKLTEKNPKIMEAHANMGVALACAGSHAKALECFDKALQIRPTAKAYHNKCIVLMQMGGKRAAECLEKALEIDPKNAGILVDMAYVKNISKDHAGAIRHLEKARILDPNSEDVLYNYIATLWALGRNGEAIELCNMATKNAPSNYRFYEQKGLVLANMGRSLEAIASFDKALSRHPTDVSTLKNKGSVLMEMKGFSRAEKCYDLALLNAPNDKDAIISKGICLGEMKKFSKAIGCFKDALRIDSKNADAYNNMGMIKMKQKRIIESISCFKSALEIVPNSAIAKANLMIALNIEGSNRFQLKKYEEAIEFFDDGIGISAENLFAYLAKAVSLCNLARYKEAMQMCNEIGRMSPNARIVPMLIEWINEAIKKNDSQIKHLKLDVTFDINYGYSECSINYE